MRQRTLGAICLGPTGNSQGGHYFMSLTSGERIIRHKWTSLPMPAEAIARVSHIGRRQGMPSSLTFSNRRDAEILDAIADTIEDDHPDVSDDDSDFSYDSDEDTSFVPGDDVSIVSDPAMSAAPAPAFPAATGVTQLDQALLDQTLGYAMALNDDHMETREHESREESDDETHEEEIAEEESYDIDDQESAGVDESAEVCNDMDDHDGTEEDDVTETGESTGVEEAERPENTGVEATNAGTLSEEFRQAEQEGREAATTSENTGPNTRSRNRNRRGRGPRNCYTLLTTIVDTFNPVTHRKLFCLVTAQMTANKGVKLFGVAGEQAIEKSYDSSLLGTGCMEWTARPSLVNSVEQHYDTSCF